MECRVCGDQVGLYHIIVWDLDANDKADLCCLTCLENWTHMMWEMSSLEFELMDNA